MKKTISVIALLLAALMIVMSFAACGDDKKSSSKEEEKLEGAYYLSSQTANGRTYNKQVIEEINDGEITLTIDSSNNGTAQSASGMTLYSGLKFDPSEHTVKTQSLTGTYKLSGDRLTISVDGQNTTFEFVKK